MEGCGAAHEILLNKQVTWSQVSQILAEDHLEGCSCLMKIPTFSLEGTPKSSHSYPLRKGVVQRETPGREPPQNSQMKIKHLPPRDSQANQSAWIRNADHKRSWMAHPWH